MSCDISVKVLALVRNELLRLAKFEDALAAAEADVVPYWVSCPDSVQAHRMAAAALRAEAEAVGMGLGCCDAQPRRVDCQRSADTTSGR